MDITMDNWGISRVKISHPISDPGNLLIRRLSRLKPSDLQKSTHNLSKMGDENRFRLVDNQITHRTLFDVW